MIATAGMIAPPINVPAMMIADGVNMPYVNFATALLALALPLVAVALIWFARLCAPVEPVPDLRDPSTGWTGSEHASTSHRILGAKRLSVAAGRRGPGGER